jgi:hypothetical protein
MKPVQVANAPRTDWSAHALTASRVARAPESRYRVFDAALQKSTPKAIHAAASRPPATRRNQSRD